MIPTGAGVRGPVQGARGAIRGTGAGDHGGAAGRSAPVTGRASEEIETVRVNGGAPPRATPGRAIPRLCLLAFLLVGLGLVATKPYPSPFDELEHVSYAAFLQETGRLLPRFEAQRTLPVDEMGRWDDRANYLGHPSPFYVFVGLFLDRTQAPGRAVLAPRLASAGLVLLGVALALRAGRRHFGRDRVALAVFCLPLALCPKLLAVAGQVTNDSLAFLGGALAYWGASLWGASLADAPGRGRAGGRRRAGLAGVALGSVFALWAKPNAGLAVGAWVGAFCLAAFCSGAFCSGASRAPRAARRLDPALAVAAGFAAGVLPYLHIVGTYGALVPVTVEQFGNVRQLGGLGAYWPAFLFTVGHTWSFSQTGTWPIPGVAALVASGLFWAMVACAFYGGVLALRRPWAEWTARDAVAAAAPVAFAAVLPIHLWFSATKLGGSLPAASFRYYLPLWPALAHALAYGVARARVPWHRVALAMVALIALVVGWLEPG